MKPAASIMIQGARILRVKSQDLQAMRQEGRDRRPTASHGFEKNGEVRHRVQHGFVHETIYKD